MRTLDVDDVLKPGKYYGALTSLTWGSNGIGFSEMGAGAIRSGAISIVGAISKHDQDDYDNGRGQRVPYTDQDLISGLAKAHIQIDSAQQVSFGTVLYNNDFTANSYNQNIDSKIYTASYTYNPASNDLINFRVSFSGSDLKMRYLSGIGTASSGTGRTIEDLGLGFDVSNTSLFNLGGIAVKSNYGYEYYHDAVDALNSIDPSKGVASIRQENLRIAERSQKRRSLRAFSISSSACVTTIIISTATPSLTPTCLRIFRPTFPFRCLPGWSLAISM